VRDHTIDPSELGVTLAPQSVTRVQPIADAAAVSSVAKIAAKRRTVMARFFGATEAFYEAL